MNKNTKKLVKYVRNRLNDFGVVVKDKENKDVKLKEFFSTSRIVMALENAYGLVSARLTVPALKFDEIENHPFVGLVNLGLVNYMLVLGASSELLLSQALVEAGREISFEDDDIAYVANNLSQMCLSQGAKDRVDFYQLLFNENMF